MIGFLILWAVISSFTGGAIVCCQPHGLPIGLSLVASMVGPLLALLVGIAVVCGAVSRILVATQFGESRTTISDTTLRYGDKFEFNFEQDWRSQTHLKSIGVFLVFRELVDSDPQSESSVRTFDRLIESYMLEERTFGRGETLRLTHAFQPPKRNLGIRNPYRDKGKLLRACWVIKVRFELKELNFEWREYELELNRYALLQGEKADFTPKREDRFDVFLVGERSGFAWKLNKTWPRTLPHCIGGYNFWPEGDKPLLLEWRTWAEAEAFKTQLEEAGAILEIRPSI